MGSSSSDVTWAVLAAFCGGLYLIFDAARYFAQQVSPVTLRRWVSDPELARKKRWFHYDPRNLHLVSGALPPNLTLNPATGLISGPLLQAANCAALATPPMPGLAMRR